MGIKATPQPHRLDAAEIARRFGATHVEKLDLTGDPVVDQKRRIDAFIRMRERVANQKEPPD